MALCRTTPVKLQHLARHGRTLSVQDCYGCNNPAVAIECGRCHKQIWDGCTPLWLNHGASAQKSTTGIRKSRFSTVAAMLVQIMPRRLTRLGNAYELTLGLLKSI